MIESLGSLFHKQPSKASLSEREGRLLLQEYLRDVCKTERLYCDSLSGSVARIRVSSPAVQQELLIRQQELCLVIRERFSLPVSEFRILVG